MLRSAVALAAVLAPSAFGAPVFSASSSVSYQGTDAQSRPCSLTITTDDQARVALVNGSFAPQPSDNGQITLYFDYAGSLVMTTPANDGFSINTTRFDGGALSTMDISFHADSAGALTAVDASTSWVGVASAEVRCANLRQR